MFKNIYVVFNISAYVGIKYIYYLARYVLLIILQKKFQKKSKSKKLLIPVTHPPTSNCLWQLENNYGIWRSSLIRCEKKSILLTISWWSHGL